VYALCWRADATSRYVRAKTTKRRARIGRVYFVPWVCGCTTGGRRHVRCSEAFTVNSLCRSAGRSLLSHTVLQRPTTPTYGCATITPNHEQFKLPHVTLRVLAACVVLLACLALPAGTQDLVTPSDRVSSHVNIRAEADEDAPEIGQLEIGQALPLVGSAPRFYQVQLPAGQTGFVSKSFTTTSRALVAREENELRVHFLNVGAGSCAVVKCPGSNAHVMIVDCGSTGATANDMNGQQTRTYIQNILAVHPCATECRSQPSRSGSLRAHCWCASIT